MIELDQLALSPDPAVGPDHFSVYKWGGCGGGAGGRVWLLRPRDVNEPVGRGQRDHPEPSPHQHQDSRPPENPPENETLHEIVLWNMRQLNSTRVKPIVKA